MNIPPRPLFIAEAPPPPYLPPLPQAVCDASALAAFIYLEPEADAAEQMLCRYTLAAPSILTLELANVGMNKLRRRLASLEELQRRLAGFDFSSIELIDVPPAAALTLAAQFKLSAYDAAYLWLAGELHAQLITFDAQLSRAAQTYLQHPLIPDS